MKFDVLVMKVASIKQASFTLFFALMPQCLTWLTKSQVRSEKGLLIEKN
jgi:hypothetical protein